MSQTHTTLSTASATNDTCAASAFPPPLNMVAQHAKQLIAMRCWLQGKQFYRALAALEYAKSFYSGFRKDGITPSFYHPLFLANAIRCLPVAVGDAPGLQDLEDVLIVAFLHDVCEDYRVGFEEIAQRFGTRIAHSTKLMTKKHRGVSVPYPEYFANLAEDPIASIVKGIDRAHNIFTMHAAEWTREKQETYLSEVYTYFLPMLKAARQRFHQQEPAYEAVKMMLTLQATHIRLYLERL